MKHKKQIAAFKDDTRFKFILAGRRGGKTHLMTEDIIKTIFNAKYGQSICYLGPSLQQAKELVWSSLCDRMRELRWPFTPVVSKSRIELTRGRKIYVLGAERIDRVRGHKFIRCYLDELAFFTHDLDEIWRAIRPTLTDFRGGAICATTPNGKGTPAYDFYQNVCQKEGWAYHNWFTLDNPYIDPAEVEEARRELDERSFKQEYEASWESFEGLAYYSFDDSLHIKPQPKLDPAKPLILSLDFNVNPSTLLLSQLEGQVMSFKKEYSLPQSSTEATISAFVEDFRGSGFSLKIRGDAAGNSRNSATGKSDYFYIEQILTKCGFSWKKEVLSSNPPIVDRLKTVNSWLKPFEAPHRVEIDPSCKDLIRDLSSQELNGRIPSDKNNLGHKADAFGYCLYWQKLIESRVAQGTTQL